MESLQDTCLWWWAGYDSEFFSAKGTFRSPLTKLLDEVLLWALLVSSGECEELDKEADGCSLLALFINFEPSQVTS